ncbi:CDP-diacylglycerol--serine O-phosphatidyltransferase [Constrictibacter sp. MBR-5]|jgi:CDP-diacylglycerol--serine O-phosphatidyltransferase|uniref:CDP-alcohol phosphatidyltransferase family protein n=1 Tax=Constrictibacter sp. MBR-5 TaxID=3156467 RepID=UPI00339B9006
MRRGRVRTRRLRTQSLARLMPNLITVLALCAGLTGIQFALLGHWRNAVLAIIVSAILDASDGRLARLLNSSSRFGAELDSLSDVISFGVAPAVILYVWTMNTAGTLGWALVLLYCVCVALRLARFNTALDDPAPLPFAHRFFTGVPAPAGAGLVLLPMVLSFQEEIGADFLQHWLPNGIVLVTVAFLLVSRVPTFSFKRVRVPPRAVLPVLLLGALTAAFLVGVPWATLTVIGLVYAASIPFSMLAHRKAVAAHLGGGPAASSGEAH